MNPLTTRRQVLRGVLSGAAVSVGLPFLDCFLNSNGTALAATGAPLPMCFGTWWQGLSFNPGRWIPKSVGPHYENNVELKVLDPFKDRINIISGSQYFLDGRPLETHVTGWQIASMGAIPTGVDSGSSLDSQIADVIGTTTRFRSIEVSIGGGKTSYSKQAGSSFNPSEPSPLELYARIFGSDFRDPNAGEFKPDPKIMARLSVLSAVKDERRSLMKQLDASDRARLDEFFTSVRQLENQLTVETEKPQPLPACTVPAKPQEQTVGSDVVPAAVNGKLFGALLAHALACGQTRVVNVVLSSMGLRQPGDPLTWHVLTHEEPVDVTLGYQKEVGWFINWANARFVEFLAQLDAIQEGPKTLLDRIVVLWQTDHGYARTHSMNGLPILTAGAAGGRLKTGLHVALTGDPATRVGLTLQQVMGVTLSSWGALSNETSKALTDLVA